MDELPRAARVKNKTPAAVQITAEQILRESKQPQEGFKKIPKQRIQDHEELDEARGVKRQQFETLLRKDRTNVGSWIKYAQYEESQYELERYCLQFSF
jgi:crooked neck